MSTPLTPLNLEANPQTLNGPSYNSTPGAAFVCSHPSLETYTRIDRSAKNTMWSPGQSRARASNLPSTTETTGPPSQRKLATMRRFLCRLKKAALTNAAAGTSTATAGDGAARDSNKGSDLLRLQLKRPNRYPTKENQNPHWDRLAKLPKLQS
ncbi:hypothetical protein M404DRAFT_544498 [Pisolithus tinctorius Marx 270]|uniref:Uncharacterized protein n=1 Tax=Pisolithus tinctorius Marx 270 TaxID=870435 RepID=A0A0C3K4W2_PISTI|nr:hypothetical protein M404DRAFT_544498 [Pisolithus tinctorius Marx 270]